MFQSSFQIGCVWVPSALANQKTKQADEMCEERKTVLVAGKKIFARMRGQYRQIAARADQKVHPACQRAFGPAWCKPGCAL
jgi:hypothetical protein